MACCVGLHIVHLYTGRVLAVAPLQLRRRRCADINGDGIVERVELAYSAGGTASVCLFVLSYMSVGVAFVLTRQRTGGSHPQMCRMRVAAGIPPRGALFDVDVCRMAPGGVLRRLWGPGGSSDGHGHELHDVRVEAAGPVYAAPVRFLFFLFFYMFCISCFLFLYIRCCLFLYLLLIDVGRDTEDLAHHEAYDALVWLNSGRVASVSPTGTLNWAAETPRAGRAVARAWSETRPDAHDPAGAAQTLWHACTSVRVCRSGR